jgi:hypothetical protein
MPVTDDDLATHFAERLLAKAKIFKNSRIKAFLSQYCD